MVAINELFITGHELVPGDAVEPPRRFLRYFPAGWPADSDGSFTTLRTHGAFLASGAAVGGVPQPLRLLSLAGAGAVMLNVWEGAAGALCVQGRAAGGGSWAPVEVAPVASTLAGLWAWGTTSGWEYEVRGC